MEKASILSVKEKEDRITYSVFYNGEVQDFFEAQLVKLENSKTNEVNDLKDVNYLKSVLTSYHILSPSLNNLFSLRSGKFSLYLISIDQL